MRGDTTVFIFRSDDCLPVAEVFMKHGERLVRVIRPSK